MATTQTGTILHHLRRMVLRTDGAGMTDGQLLKEFVFHRDAAAFESLVRRHGPMVMGVCRRIVRDPHDAEDAFQSTFLVLARKAASVSPPEMVGNWLYGVAQTTAVRFRAANAKRRVREKQVPDMPEPTGEQKDRQDELLRLLDEELARLPDKYRLPIVLCDLEGRTRREVAQQLKLPEGTLSSRLTTGRRMLAKRLANRGLAVSGGTLAAALSQSSASACISLSLVSSTVKAATLSAAGHCTIGLISAPVATLTEGVLKTMYLTKLKAIMATMLVIASLGGAAGVLYQTQAAEQPMTQQVNATATQEKRPAADKDKKPKPDKQQLPADDSHAIQGVWHILPVTPVDREGVLDFAVHGQVSRWIINAETIEIHGKNGMVGFSYKLDSSKSPKKMDLKVLGHTIPAIYALDGDFLQIRMSPHERTRPLSLNWHIDGRSIHLMLMREPRLKRAEATTGKAEERKQPAEINENFKREMEQLQGRWKITSEVDNGEKDESAIGDEWTFKYGAVQAIDQPRKKKGAFTSYLGFRLNPTANPKRIDFVDAKADDWSNSAALDKRLDDNDLRMEAIYALTGDRLTICLSLNSRERPTAFESKKGSNHILLTFRRQNPKKAEESGADVRKFPPVIEEKKTENAKPVVADRETYPIRMTLHKLPVKAATLAPLLQEMAWNKYHDDRLIIDTGPDGTLKLWAVSIDNINWARGVIDALFTATKKP